MEQFQGEFHAELSFQMCLIILGDGKHLVLIKSWSTVVFLKRLLFRLSPEDRLVRAPAHWFPDPGHHRLAGALKHTDSGL
jgi:hypothetical protein